MLETLLAMFTNAFLPVIGTLFSGIATYVATLLVSKVKNSNISDALGRVSMTAETVVKSIEQTTVSALKAAAADGKLTKEDAKSVKDAAVKKLKDQLPSSVLEVANAGVTSLETFISDKIEKAVNDLKKKK